MSTTATSPAAMATMSRARPISIAWHGTASGFPTPTRIRPSAFPARASFATGRYPHQIGAWDSATPYDGTVKGWGARAARRGARGGVCRQATLQVHRGRQRLFARNPSHARSQRGGLGVQPAACPSRAPQGGKGTRHGPRRRRKRLHALRPRRDETGVRMDRRGGGTDSREAVGPLCRTRRAALSARCAGRVLSPLRRRHPPASPVREGRSPAASGSGCTPCGVRLRRRFRRGEGSHRPAGLLRLVFVHGRQRRQDRPRHLRDGTRRRRRGSSIRRITATTSATAGSGASRSCTRIRWRYR